MNPLLFAVDIDGGGPLLQPIEPRWVLLALLVAIAFGAWNFRVR